MKNSVGKCRFTDTIPPLRVVKILSLLSVPLDLRGPAKTIKLTLADGPKPSRITRRSTRAATGHHMADWYFEEAKTYEDLLAAHEKWVRDYNYQKHFAHEQREDGRHSPAEVLGWVTGKQFLLFRTARFQALPPAPNYR